MTPSSVDSTFSSFPNTTLFSFGTPSLESPLPTVMDLEYWAPKLDRDCHTLSPLVSPFADVSQDYLPHVTPDIEMASLKPEDFIPCERQAPTDHKSALLGILRQLRGLSFTVLDILTFILNGDSDGQVRFSSVHGYFC